MAWHLQKVNRLDCHIAWDSVQLRIQERLNEQAGHIR